VSSGDDSARASGTLVVFAEMWKFPREEALRYRRGKWLGAGD
jgi:hypothetical protein